MDNINLHFVNFQDLISSNNNYDFIKNLNSSFEENVVLDLNLMIRVSELEKRINSGEKLKSKDDIKLLVSIKSILTKYYQVKSQIADLLLESEETNNYFDQLILDLHMLVKKHIS